MSEYTQAIATALRLVTLKGRALMLKRFDEGGFDPITGQGAPAAFIETGMKAVQTMIGKSDSMKMDARLVEALTQGKLRKLIVAASGLTFEPEPNDVTAFDSAYWTVRGVSCLKPATEPILYYLIVESTTLSEDRAEAMDLVEFEAQVDATSEMVNEDLPPLLQ